MTTTTTTSPLIEKFLENGGRLTHVKRSRGRVLTIAYFNNESSGYVAFAGSMFTPDETCRVFTRRERRQNNENAVQRLLTQPVVIPNPTPQIWGPSRTDPNVQARFRGHEDSALREYLSKKAIPRLGVKSDDNQASDYIRILLTSWTRPSAK